MLFPISHLAAARRAGCIMFSEISCFVWMTLCLALSYLCWCGWVISKSSNQQRFQGKLQVFWSTVCCAGKMGEEVACCKPAGQPHCVCGFSFCIAFVTTISAVRATHCEDKLHGHQKYSLHHIPFSCDWARGHLTSWICCWKHWTSFLLC